MVGNKLNGGEIVADSLGKQYDVELTGTNDKPMVLLVPHDDPTGPSKEFPEKDLPTLYLVQGSAPDTGSQAKWFQSQMGFGGGSSSWHAPSKPVKVDYHKLRGHEIVKNKAGKQFRVSLVWLDDEHKMPGIELAPLGKGDSELYLETELPDDLTLVQGGGYSYSPPKPFAKEWDDAHTVQLDHPAGGTNGARIAKAEDGTEWLVKGYSGNQDRVATELLSNAVYRKLGIKVPEAGTLEFKGQPALAYPLVDGKQHRWKEPRARRLPTGSWPTRCSRTGTSWAWSQDNVLWSGDPDKEADAVPTRIDQGGTLFFRAMGSSKPFGPVPTEVWTMAGPRGQAFGTMDRSDDKVKQRGGGEDREGADPEGGGRPGRCRPVQGQEDAGGRAGGAEGQGGVDGPVRRRGRSRSRSRWTVRRPGRCWRRCSRGWR